MTQGRLATAAWVSVAAAFWPVWRWLFARHCDGTGEEAGVCAWALAAVVTVSLVRRSSRPPVRTDGMWIAVSFCTLYVASFRLLPPLLRAVICVAVITSLVSALHLQSRFRLSLFALLLLGLPVEASLQFYLGYPLRMVVTEVACLLLHGMGISATAHGTQLAWGTIEVSVDAPCSGVAMLRVALISCSALSLARRSGLLGTTILLAATALLSVSLNAVRSASLFFLEGGLLPGVTDFAEVMHTAVGLVAFALLMLAQCWVSGVLINRARLGVSS